MLKINLKSECRTNLIVTRFYRGHESTRKRLIGAVRWIDIVNYFSADPTTL